MTRAILLILLATLCSQPQPVPTQGERGAVIPTVGASIMASGTIVEAVNGAPRVSVRITFYCVPGWSRCTKGYGPTCFCAAVSPDLSRFRGHHVQVCAGSRCVRVKIVDCNCRTTRGVDLYGVAFRALAPLRVGVLKGTVRAVE